MAAAAALRRATCTVAVVPDRSRREGGEPLRWTCSHGGADPAEDKFERRAAAGCSGPLPCDKGGEQTPPSDPDGGCAVGTRRAATGEIEDFAVAAMQVRRTLFEDERGKMLVEGGAAVVWPLVEGATRAVREGVVMLTKPSGCLALAVGSEDLFPSEPENDEVSGREPFDVTLLVRPHHKAASDLGESCPDATVDVSSDREGGGETKGAVEEAAAREEQT